MMLSVEAQLLIHTDIKRINKIKDYQKRVDELIAVKQKIVAALYDDLDDVLCAVDLTRDKQEAVVVKKVEQLSIAFDEEEQAQMDQEQLLDAIVEHVDGLYWYDKKILELYIQHGTYRAVAKETNIPYSSIFKTVQKVIKEVKQKVKNEDH